MAFANSETPITENDLAIVPKPARRYLISAGVIGKLRSSIAHIKHVGRFRTNPNQKWMTLTAEYHLSTNRPSLTWLAKIRVLPLLSISVVDTYIQGKGRFVAKVASLFKISDGKGAEIDESSLGRLLAESVMIPTLLVPNQYVHWEAINSSSARAIIKDENLEASAEFHFGKDGFPTSVLLQRYKADKHGAHKYPFRGIMRCFKEFDGMKIPTEMEAVWILPTGEFNFANFLIKEAHYGR